VFSSHNPPEAQRHADRLLVLDGGLLVFEGTPAELISRSAVAEADLELALVAFLAAGTGVSG
jgi:ABC-type multidrug transport system ATPase subunit